jgi:hypothetical protein
VDTQVVEEVHPSQWTELYPGSFTFNYILTSTRSKRIYQTINSTIMGLTDIVNIQQMQPTLELVNPSYPLLAGQPMSLQLSSSMVDFASLAGSSSGWRVEVVWPAGTTTDLGLMASWEVFAGVVYKRNMTLPGSSITAVS